MSSTDDLLLGQAFNLLQENCLSRGLVLRVDTQDGITIRTREAVIVRGTRAGGEAFQWRAFRDAEAALELALKKETVK